MLVIFLQFTETRQKSQKESFLGFELTSSYFQILQHCNRVINCRVFKSVNLEISDKVGSNGKTETFIFKIY
jgi:hypothetical protein